MQFLILRIAVRPVMVGGMPMFRHIERNFSADTHLGEGRMANILALAGPNSKYKKPDAAQAGFWIGLWHGLLIPLTFVVSLFTAKVRIYETHNKGRLYDFAFILGIGLLGPVSIYIGPYQLL